MRTILAKERAFLKENQETLRREYPGKYLLIKGTEVHGAFETRDEGVDAGVRRFPTDAFLVRSVENVDDPIAHIPALSVGVPLCLP